MAKGRPRVRTEEYWQEYNRQYRIKNKEHLAKYHKVYRETHPRSLDQRSDENLRCAFGLTLAQYIEMLKEQGGCCAVCEQKPTTIRLAVDHDHVTGTIRGLLCIGCNTTVGKLRDSPELVEKLRRYLYKHSQLKLVS